MADETTTAVPEAGQTPAPVEHTASATDPNAVETALQVLAEQPAEVPAEVPAAPKGDGDFEPLGIVINCP
ncbi:MULTISPECIES: hypothetical protein [Kitasatospora]|uniref:Uncharacterized protein n=1 Tax=Kitasatospora setae (strain ATCC 33774 / DSM 43861 / JCM 3304 / KCC A-0304 / NBRC 14216 / KM-6054) TaxID=452652 RepID=E4NGC9_KITSK|nr:MULTISPECIES: hypothetical protein [Kitasatospora]BAJ30559.1 hypothetical protein KSE_47790 [Kitasatospora setae KM-6054]